MDVIQRNCPLCASRNTEYEFQVNNRRLRRCFDCELLFATPFPESSDDALGYTPAERFADAPTLIGALSPAQLLEWLQGHSKGSLRRIAVAGSGASGLTQMACTQGIEVLELKTDDPKPREETGEIDACILMGVLGEKSHPAAQLAHVHSFLKPGGVLLLTLPTVDDLRARPQKAYRSAFRAPRAAYFDTHSLSALLVRCGFCDIRSWSRDNGAVVVCRKAKQRSEEKLPRLSIVLPVYNEQATCKELIDTVLAKNIEGAEREVVIVESNSTDGSREIVRAYEGHPDVRIIYEDQPRGKGYAVRNGIAHATGDVLLIQDADLEYDIEDYDSLLEPLFSQRRLFVLGSRHKGNWKMREFEDRRWLGAVFNFGQIFFTWLINVTCNTHLMDPFTMYKVFHRECLYGLELEANRFDLDWEIVIKFVRKGLIPLEIPVNYVSRSFSEGKKVRPLHDPILWFRALVKFRYGPLYGSAVREGRTR